MNNEFFQGQRPIPLLGQQQAMAEQHMQQMYLGCYLQLIPVVAASKLRDREVNSGGFSSPEQYTPEAIAEESDRIAIAAMKRIGITITKNQ